MEIFSQGSQKDILVSNKSYISTFRLIGIYLVFAAIFSLLISQVYQLTGGCIMKKGDNFRFPDFIYYYIVAKAFWIKKLLYVYSPETLTRVFSEEFSIGFKYIMPLGITPLSLFLFVPLVFLNDNYEIVIFIWNFISIFIFILGCDFIRLSILKKHVNDRFFWIFTYLLVFFSDLSLGAMLLGQTTLIATGALLLLIINKKEKQLRFVDIILVLLTTFKPIYLIAAFVLLVESRKYKLIFISSVLFLCQLFCLVYMAGVEIVIDYLNILQLFSSANIPNYYALSFAPQTTTVFQNAFSKYFELNILNSISKIILISGLLIIAFFLICRILFDFCKFLKINLKIKLIQLDNLFVLFLSIMLLFSPYLGGYEDLLLVVFVTSLLRIDDDVSCTTQNESFIINNIYFRYFFFICLFIIVNREMIFEVYSVTFLWFIKIVVVFLIFTDLIKKSFNSRPIISDVNY